jgi:uncharacterized membrane protein
MSATKRIVIALAILGVITYLWLMHASANAPDAVARTFVITVITWQVFLIAILLPRGKWFASLLIAAPTPLLFLYYDKLIHLQFLCVVPNLFVHGSLMWFFGRTLFAPHVPLITQLALRIHGSLPDAIRDYTRHVTVVWTGYFALMILGSLGLYFIAGFAAWSKFSNVYAMPLMIALFIVEYAYRRLRFPWFEHVSILAGIRAFTQVGTQLGATEDKPAPSEKS